MKSPAQSFGILIAAIELTVFALVAQAQTYHVTDLGTINTDPETGVVSSHPTGINTAGQVTGRSYSGTSNHAARFTNGLVEDLGTIPGGSTSTGVGINDLGQVVGDSQYSINGGSIRHAALFSNGTVTDLGVLPGWGNYARGNGINNLGEVVGHSGTDLDTNVTRAFIWDAANGMRDLGTLGGGYAKAFSINDSSVVTGRADTGGGFGSNFHAFIWDTAGGMRDLGTIAGSSSSGNFINANGHVAGWSSISTDNRHHAFLHDGATMHDLGAIGNNDFFTDRSEAYGVNIHDVVVGTTYRPYQGGGAYAIAFVYRDGQMLDLETLVDESGANYRLYTATGINDAGQIAVDAIRLGTPDQIRAVLLTPTGSSTPTPTPAPTATPAATPIQTPITISGNISYCSNPVLSPVPSVTLTLTGDATTSEITDGSGNYQFPSLTSGWSYTVTPAKASLAPGASGINTMDAIAIQRHFLVIATPLSGCRLWAADTNHPPNGVDTPDAIATQRFFLGLTTGIAQTGLYKFTPSSRSYSPITSNQTAQDYSTVILGDAAAAFAAPRLDGGPSQDTAGENEVPATVTEVALPEVIVDQSKSNFIAQVTTSAIDAKNKLVGFQGDFTFDERVATFQSEPVQKAGLTSGNWNVSGNVLPGVGPIRTLRVSAYSNDFTPLSGSGTLFELRIARLSKAAQGTQLIWAAPPDQFIFIDADLHTQKPGNAAPGSVTQARKRQ